MLHSKGELISLPQLLDFVEATDCHKHASLMRYRIDYLRKKFLEGSCGQSRKTFLAYFTVA